MTFGAKHVVQQCQVKIQHNMQNIGREKDIAMVTTGLNCKAFSQYINCHVAQTKARQHLRATRISQTI
jgi:hypothetical protein